MSQTATVSRPRLFTIAIGMPIVSNVPFVQAASPPKPKPRRPRFQPGLWLLVTIFLFASAGLGLLANNTVRALRPAAALLVEPVDLGTAALKCVPKCIPPQYCNPRTGICVGDPVADNPNLDLSGTEDLP